MEAKDYILKSYMSSKKLDLNKGIKLPEIFGTLQRKEPSFMLFKLVEKSFVYLKDYGGVCYFNVEDELIRKLNYEIVRFFSIDELIKVDFLKVIVGQHEKYKAGFDELFIPKINLDIVHILCLNLAQSAALFLYQEKSEIILESTNAFTQELVNKGRISLGRRKLFRFIGNTLYLKNNISQHLYIFDAPMLTWADEDASKTDALVKEDLEIGPRYNALKEQLNTVQENLDLFKDLNLHQYSNRLEWIIILLILFEVIHALV